MVDANPTTDPVSRPILFSAPMIRALLDGRKTQTRRIIKPTPVGLWGGTDLHTHTFVGIANGRKGAAEHPVDHCWNCPYGKPGDLLWVRECHSLLESSITGRAPSVWYWADGNPSEGDYTKPRPSIHMHRWASRITLHITEIRIERLQAINEYDARAEGIAWNPRLDPCGRCHFASVVEANTGWDSATAAYHELWESINGKGSWDTNPWVWVVKFERVADSMRAAA